MAYSATELTTIITSVGTLVGVLAAAILGVITAIRAKAIVEKTDLVSGQVEMVHVQTNSYLSRLETKLETSQTDLANAIQMVKSAEIARVNLASEAASVLRQAPVAVAAPPQVIVVSDKGAKLG